MFENKKIFILGMARSGYEVSKLLAKHSNTIFITDLKDQDEKELEELRKLGVTYQTLKNPEDYLDTTFDYVVKNPGIRKDHACVQKARDLHIPVINELEVAYSFFPKDTKIIGITGSNGKTTVTTMIYEVLKKELNHVYLAGNIGVPLSKMIGDMKEGSTLVIEISDHQLIDMYQFKTDISILTNLSEVHLDFHKDYESYKAVKKKIFQNHTKKDLSILNADNTDVLTLTEDILSTKTYFSGKTKADAYIEKNQIYIKGNPVLALEDIQVKGMHNYENIMCMFLVLDYLQIPFDSAKEFLKTFSGVEHRLEYVKSLFGREFYNDSKSTNTESTIIALKTFTKPTILLLGGTDRGHSFHPLEKEMNYVKKVVCYGETKDRIEAWAKDIHIDCAKVNTLKEATIEAYESANEGDVILLSPACASWDQYNNFEDRGNEFKDTVNQL